MARRSSKSLQLRLFFEQATEPCYVVSEGRIVFANKALSAWLGTEHGALTGRPCTRGSSDGSEIGDTAVRLCPPVELLDKSGCQTFRLVNGVGDTRIAYAISFDTSAGPEPVVAIWASRDPVDPWIEGELQRETEAARLRSELLQLTASVGSELPPSLCGRSTQIARVRRQLETIAARPASTMIRGPTGVGREEIARYLFRQAQGFGGKQVSDMFPIACPLMDASLMKASWDMMAARMGEGHRCWLLLVDVDQLTVEAQAVLSGGLASQADEALVTVSTSRVDVLREPQGDFDRELALRLSIFDLEIPSLAARREDIEQIAQFILEQRCAEQQRQLDGFTTAALDRLAAYEWPENTAELEEVVSQAVSAAAGPTVDVSDLPRLFDLADDAAIHPQRSFKPIDLDALLARVEMEVARRAWRASRGNKTQVAKLLGISRQRAIRLVREFEPNEYGGGTDVVEDGDG